MRHFRPTVALATLTLACGGGGVDVVETPDAVIPPTRPWEAFALADLQTQRLQQNAGFLEFLSESQLRMGLYHLTSGALDTQDVHGEDEIYYVVDGSGTIRIDGTDYEATAGSAFFVKAQVSHRFHTITSDMNVLVVFAAAPSWPSDPPALAYGEAEMAAQRSPSTNVWNLFLQTQTMSLGMYMLPSAVGGDDPLVHPFDEINIVTRGTGRFQMGLDEIDIGVGSVVYVQQDVLHRFSSVSEDLDVLILWVR
jgi:mannose-6-phosphate isomerase-like protein (cupin superfamily)